MLENTRPNRDIIRSVGEDQSPQVERDTEQGEVEGRLADLVSAYFYHAGEHHGLELTFVSGDTGMEGKNLQFITTPHQSMVDGQRVDELRIDVMVTDVSERFTAENRADLRASVASAPEHTVNIERRLNPRKSVVHIGPDVGAKPDGKILYPDGVGRLLELFLFKKIFIDYTHELDKVRRLIDTDDTLSRLNSGLYERLGTLCTQLNDIMENDALVAAEPVLVQIAETIYHIRFMGQTDEEIPSIEILDQLEEKYKSMMSILTLLATEFPEHQTLLPRLNDLGEATDAARRNWRIAAEEAWSQLEATKRERLQLDEVAHALMGLNSALNNDYSLANLNYDTINQVRRAVELLRDIRGTGYREEVISTFKRLEQAIVQMEFTNRSSQHVQTIDSLALDAVKSHCDNVIRQLDRLTGPLMRPAQLLVNGIREAENKMYRY